MSKMNSKARTLKYLFQVFFGLMLFILPCVDSYSQTRTFKEQNVLYEKFRENRKGNAKQKKIACEAAKEFMRGRELIELCEIYEYVEYWIEKYEASLKGQSDNNGIENSHRPPLNDSDPTDFYRFVLDSFGQHSPYILLEVESEAYAGKVVVENGSLLDTLNRSMGLNKEQYQQYMLDFFKKKGRLKLTSIEFYKGNFHKLKTMETVESNAAKGKDYFIEYYFPKDFFLRRDISDDEKHAVIAKLFEWEGPTMVHDYSGFLRLLRIRKKDN